MHIAIDPYIAQLVQSRVKLKDHVQNDQVKLLQEVQVLLPVLSVEESAHFVDELGLIVLKFGEELEAPVFEVFEDIEVVD